jgi:hypothetical protein
MKETIIAAIVTAAIGATLLTAIHRGRAVAELEAEVTRLEQQVQARQVMLDDAHRLYGVLERRVMKIDTGMSARELLWHIQEIADNTDCVVVK